MKALCVRAKTKVSAENLSPFFGWRQEKKEHCLTVSTIQERNKKNAKYHVGDYWNFETIAIDIVSQHDHQQWICKTSMLPLETPYKIFLGV